MQIYFVNLTLKKIHKCFLKRCGLAIFKVTTSLEDIFGCSCYHGVLRPPQHLHVEEVELPLKVLPQLLQVRWLRPEHLALKIAPQKEIQRVEVGTARGPLNTAVSLRAHCQNASSKLLRQFSHERRVPMHGCPVLLPPRTIQIS